MPAARYAAWESHLRESGHPPGDYVAQRLLAEIWAVLVNALGGRGDEDSEPPANAAYPVDVWPEGYPPDARAELERRRESSARKRRAARLSLHRR